MNPEITITYTDEDGLTTTKVSHDFEGAGEDLGKIERFVNKTKKEKDLDL